MTRDKFVIRCAPPARKQRNRPIGLVSLLAPRWHYPQGRSDHTVPPYLSRPVFEERGSSYAWALLENRNGVYMII